MAGVSPWEAYQAFPIAAEALSAFPVQVRRTILRLDRGSIEKAVEGLIAYLDTLDGDPDLEPDEDFGVDDVGEGSKLYATGPRYGEDQSRGPTNFAAACRAHQLRLLRLD